MSPKLDPATLNQLLPMVRAVSRNRLMGQSVHVLAVERERIIGGRSRNGFAIFEDDPDVATLKQRLRSVREIEIDDQTQAVFERGGRRLKIAKLMVRNSKTRYTQLIPNDDTKHLAAALQHLLGDRVQYKNGISKVGIFLGLLSLLCLGVAGYLSTQLNAIGLVFALGFFGVITLGVAFYEMLHLGFPWEVEAKKAQAKRKAQKDRSGRNPFRSRWIGWPLKVISALLLLGIWLFGSGALHLLAIPVLAIFYLGHLLVQVPPKYVSSADSRAPILYLRSFLDDRKTSLMPRSRAAVLLGAIPPSSMPAPWCYILLLNPIRILRILFGKGVDTSEEQLGLFFRKRGPFIAIGKPGEKFATPGASKVYVTNEQWQNVVLEYLSSSQTVLLQPAKTEGVWWEVAQSLQKCEPQKLLLCMLNFYNKQNDYERFRLRAQEFLPRPLPRQLAYSRTPTFVYFDKAWNPFVQQVSCRDPFTWPILGDAVDLDYTLAPFLKSVSGEPTPPPRAPRGLSSGHRSLAVAVHLALAVILLPLAKYALLATFVGAVPTAAQAPENRLAMVPNSPAPVTATKPNDVPPSTAPVPADSNTNVPPQLTREELETKLEANPGDVAALKALGILESNSGNYKKALPLLDRAMELAGDIETQLERASVRQEVMDFDGALKDLQSVIQQDPQNPRAHNDLGFLYGRQGNLELAIAEISKAIEISPHRLYLNNRGILNCQAQQYEQSFKDLSDSLKMDGEQPVIYYWAGKALMGKGETVEAMRYFNTALQKDPTIYDAYVQRAEGFIKLRDQADKDFRPLDLAKRDLEKFLSQYPENQSVKSEHAAVAVLDERYADALLELQPMIEKDPGDASLINLRIAAYMGLERYDEALADIDALLAKAPEDENLFLKRIKALLAKKEAEQAVKELSTFIDKHPQSISVVIERARLYVSQGHYESGSQDYQRILELQPNLLFAYEKHADANVELGRYDAAIESYDKAAKLMPTKFATHVMLVLLYAWQDPDKALVTFDKMREDFSANPHPVIQEWLLRFALLLNPEGIDWPQLETETSKLVVNHPDPQNAQITLAMVAYRSGRVDEAASQLAAVSKEKLSSFQQLRLDLWQTWILNQKPGASEAAAKLKQLQTQLETEFSRTLVDGQVSSHSWQQRLELHLLDRLVRRSLSGN